MIPKSLRTSLGGLVVVSAACVLSACGSATVETDSDATSVPPLTRSASASSTPTTTSSSGSAPVAQDSAAVSDRAGQEISEIPAGVLALSPEDQRYINALKEAGVDVNGMENQIITAGTLVCKAQDDQIAAATAKVVAGQLIEQNRSKLEYAELVAQIDKTAREAYC
ncbi:hypothetical protein EML15_05100 [Corynebacterium sp. sy017]|uniref:DUF732 domain-containing protein n=1 Tax=unclassified Corynebacterium TaxID=2624378 RepID=UPI00118648C4|nr:MULTISPECIES: DUF732 domain-containing protein [unclassified Corynebacterium]MBP3088522.1 hypothetical protein [Corynebacterium sp. sy017]TSD91827.1 hypothetical protein ELY17_05100 [Corynebacterium sp. SY003]